MSSQNDNANTSSKQTTTLGERHTITNMEKYGIYKNQHERLKLAIDNGFYLEAIVIEYAIMEDRTAAILRYEGNTIVPKSERDYISITRKVKKIADLSRQKDSLIGRYFAKNLEDKCDLTDEILAWIDTKNSMRYNTSENDDNMDRNSLIHNLMNIITTTDGLREIAEKGAKLCKDLSNRTNSYKGMVERRNAKQVDE
jgi:hypothetical protein